MSSNVSGVTQAASSGREPAYIGFIIAWLFCVVFYFAQYALRSAPGVMMPELTKAFALDMASMSTLIGLYYYTYSIFAIVFGAALDRLGAKYVVPAGILLVAVGAAMFCMGGVGGAQFGRLLQGAGSAAAFTGAVYLATHGFPPRYLATAVGFTQCFGMLGGSAGQFAVAPMIHSIITWEQFWWLSGLGLFVVAVLVCLATPSGHDAGSASQGSWTKMFAPYKVVLTNPQSYLCGFCAGLLFLPTTIGDMIWGVPFLRDGLGVQYAEAVNRTSMVPLGWVIGCPLLGYISDHIGRRKPVLIAGALLMLVSGIGILYFPNSVPPYVCGLLLGIGSGAAMLPYSSIKEVNPDNVKGSATGAINFLVFTFSAFVSSLFSKLIVRYEDGGKLTLEAFQQAAVWLLGAIVLGIVLGFFMRETGPRTIRQH
ncbi:MAG: MFS transporter [Burkholderiaceae bacterium]|jgi:MFS family permease|nr:MFS transporter [Burkholderiaceae bacterium]